jgi:voltage-gated potassium channel
MIARGASAAIATIDCVNPVLEAFQRLMSYEERHRRLLGRLGMVLVLTLVVDLVGTVAVYFLERHAQGTEIHSVGDAVFFTTVQLLTVSSQIKNPLTPGGRVVDVILEIWGVVVVAGSAGAIAAFFQSADRPRNAGRPS